MERVTRLTRTHSTIHKASHGVACAPVNFLRLACCETTDHRLAVRAIRLRRSRVTPAPASRVSTLRTDYTYAVRFVTLQYTALYVVSTAVCSTHDINRACTDQSSAVYAMHRYDSLYRVMVRATSQCSESCHNRSKTLRLLHPKPGTIWVQFAFRRGRCRFARWSSG